jgi:hypothetical protein
MAEGARQYGKNLALPKIIPALYADATTERLYAFIYREAVIHHSPGLQPWVSSQEVAP